MSTFQRGLSGRGLLMGVTYGLLLVAGAIVFWPRQGGDDHHVVILGRSVAGRHLGYFLDDLDCDGRIEQVFADKQGEGFVVNRADPGMTNRIFPGVTVAHVPSVQATVSSGLDHADLNGDGKDEILHAYSYGDSLLIASVHSYPVSGRWQGMIMAFAGCDSARVIGWSVCRGDLTDPPLLVAASRLRSGKTLLSGFAPTLRSDPWVPPSSPIWESAAEGLVGFLGHTAPDSSAWGRCCLLSTQFQGEEVSENRLLCLDGLTGEVIWERHIGYGNGGALCWVHIGRAKELVVASGRGNPNTEAYSLMCFDVDGRLVRKSNPVDSPFAFPLSAADLDCDGCDEIVTGSHAGKIRLYRHDLEDPYLVSPKLCDGIVWGTPFREGGIFFVAHDQTSLWLLDAHLVPLHPPERFEFQRFGSSATVFDHPLWDKVLVIPTTGQRDGYLSYAFIDPLALDPLIPTAFRTRAQPVTWALGLAGLVVGILLVGRQNRSKQQVSIEPEVISLYMSLRDFRHSEPAWRVFRGLARLLATLEQRRDQSNAELIGLIEQRIETMRLSSFPSIDKVIESARLARWRTRSIEQLAHQKRRMAELLEDPAGPTPLRQLCEARPEELRQTATELADLLEELGESARAERRSDPLIVISELLTELPPVWPGDPESRIRLEVTGNAAICAYLPADVLHQLLKDSLGALWHTEAPIGSGEGSCRLAYRAESITITLSRNLGNPKTAQRSICGFQDDSIWSGALIPFGTNLAARVEGAMAIIAISTETAR